MHFHAFNIGQPHIDAWWIRNLQLGIISAGFDGEPGDRGDVLLHQMDEGDWVFAYSNGHGFVGAGQVGSVSSYRLLMPSDLPDGWESNHRHLRQVDWIYSVGNLAQGIPAGEVQRNAPRQTKELLSDEVGYHLLKLLANRDERALSKETLQQFKSAFVSSVEMSSQDTSDARQQRLKNAKKFALRKPVLSYEFVRNPDVVAEVLYRAEGTCGRCLSPAPFARRADGAPYLEVHHKMPLSFGGEDTVENAIALCPNCHRQLHYGQSVDQPLDPADLRLLDT